MDTQQQSQLQQQQAQLQQQQAQLQQQLSNNNNNSILHVRGDSETQLELLFSVLKSNEAQQSNQTYRNKNLPLSFFNPPKPKPPGHVPEGSLDGTVPGAIPPQVSGALHMRSHSSPAPLAFSVAAPPNQGGVTPNPAPVQPRHHVKQGSMDGLIDGRVNQQRQVQGIQHQHQGSWPSNQIVSSYINGVGAPPSSGIWSVSNPQSAGAKGGILTNSPCKPPKSSSSSAGGKPPICTTSSDPLGPLPPGWDRGVTNEGDVYYINHIDKTTSWQDPRTPKHHQKGTPSKGSNKTMFGSSVQPPAACKQPQQYHPQLLTAAGQQPQLLAAAGQQQHAALAADITNLSVNESLIRAELKKLQKEKERLHLEQEENKRKEQMLLTQLNSVANVPGVTTGFPGGSAAPGLSGLDPFLGPPVLGPPLHVRQSSGDSGHGGSFGGTFSLPRQANNEFIDSIDMQDAKSVTSMDFKIQDQPDSTSTLGLGDMSTFIDSEPVNMDSDDLVASLNEDITRDLLNMDPQTVEKLLWL